MKTAAKRRLRRETVPFDCVRLRVERAIASRRALGLPIDPEVERWLGGCRCFDSLIVPEERQLVLPFQFGGAA